MSTIEILVYIIAGLLYIFAFGFIAWLIVLLIKSFDFKAGILANAPYIFIFLIMAFVCFGMASAFKMGLKVFIPGVKAAIYFNRLDGDGYLSYDRKHGGIISEYDEPAIACNMDIGGNITIDNEILLPTKCSSNSHVIKRELTFNSFPLNKKYNNSIVTVNGDLKYLNSNGLSYPFIKYSVNKSDNCLEDIVWSGTFNNNNWVSFDDSLMGEDQKKYYLFIWIDEEEMEEYREFKPFQLEPRVSCKLD